MKTNLDKQYKLDSDLEANGVDFEIPAVDDQGNPKNASFKLRPFKGTNPRIKAAMANHYKPYARQIDMGILDAKKDLEIRIKLFLDVCLVSWQNVEADDKPLEFSKTNALALFTALPELFETLWKQAQDSNNYREDLGN